MAITPIKSYQTNRTAPIAFKGLEQLKFTSNFNPLKNSKDYLTIRAFLTSDAFKYLFENAKVKALFEKIESKDEPVVRTILHYSYVPLETNSESKKTLGKRILSAIKKHFIDDVTRHEWIEGWENTKTGESNLIYKKIMNVTKDSIKENL